MILEVVMSSGNGNEHGIPVANLRLALFHLTRDVTNELEGPRISVLPSVRPGRSLHLHSCSLFTQFCIDLSVVDHPIPQTNSGPVKGVLTPPCAAALLPKRVVWMKTSYRTTTGRVPGVVAGGPRQRVGEGGEEEAQRPGDDHVVVEVHVEGDQHHRVADPFNKTHMQLVVQ